MHKLCQQSADTILKEFHPNLMIAIGGGGYVPARILRYDQFKSRMRHATCDMLGDMVTDRFP